MESSNTTTSDIVKRLMEDDTVHKFKIIYNDKFTLVKTHLYSGVIYLSGYVGDKAGTLKPYRPIRKPITYRNKEIIDLYRKEFTQMDIADLFQISQSLVSNVIRTIPNHIPY